MARTDVLDRIDAVVARFTGYTPASWSILPSLSWIRTDVSIRAVGVALLAFGVAFRAATTGASDRGLRPGE